MRVYIPATLNDIARGLADGVFARAGTTAHAVTAAVREWYVDGDEEELEFAASLEAAHACLRRLAADPAAPRRRVVISADVPEGDVATVADGPYRSSIVLSADVLRSSVACLHVDEELARDVVTAAVEALPSADRGDDDAAFIVDEAEATVLLWYDASEIATLLDSRQ